MKRIIVLFVAILIISPITAYASGRCTSRLFVVRNWKAPITLDSTTPDSTDEVETEEPGKPEEPTTPAPTDEVEMLETEETVEQTIPPADDEGDDIELEEPVEQAEPLTDEVDHPDGEVEQGEAPAEDNSEEIEEPEETAAPVADNSGDIEPENQAGQEEPEDGRPAEAIETSADADESEDSVEPTVIDAPPAMGTEKEMAPVDTEDAPDDEPEAS